jgi:hypothetical protein
VTHHGLKAFWRPIEILDKQGRGGVAKHVEAVTMAHDPLALRILLAGVHGQAAFDLQRVPCVLDNVPHALDLSSATRENEIAVALGTTTKSYQDFRRPLNYQKLSIY